MFKTIPTLSQQTRNPIDEDGDGTIDRIAHLDAEGRWERVDMDDDGEQFGWAERNSRPVRTGRPSKPEQPPKSRKL